MIHEEWKNLFKRKFNLVALIVIFLIPAIYTITFLGSMWDVYGKMSDFPVAVVNEDRATTYNGETISVGNDLVKKLRTSDELNFNFTSQAAAEKGLKNGKYYLVIIIPENFSSNAATVMDDKPLKMNLQYETNPGTNFIASKFSESGILRVKERLSKEVINTYTTAIMKEFKTVGNGFSDAADGSGKIDNALFKLIAGNEKIFENLKTLSDGTVTFSDGADQLSDGLVTYTDGVKKVNAGTKTLYQGVESMTDKNGSLANGINKLNTSEPVLVNGVTSYTSGVAQAYAGTTALSINSNSLVNGVTTVSGGITQLQSGTSNILTSLNSLSSTLDSELSDSNKDQLTQLQQGLVSFNKNLQAVNSAVKGISLDTAKLQSALSELKSASDSLTTSSSDIAKMQASIQDLENTDSLTDAQKAILTELKSELSDLDSSNSDVSSDIGNASGNLQDFAVTLSDLNTKFGSLQQNIAALAGASATLMPGSQEAISTLESGLEQIQTGLTQTGSTTDTMGLIQAVNMIDSGLKTIQTGMTDKNDGLIAGVKAYTGGVDSLNGGLKTLDSNSASLVSGAQAFGSGVTQLSSGITDGLTQLNSGVSALYSGTSTLTANNNSLLSGASELSTAAGTISSGASKLAVGSETLGTGMEKTEKGTATLTGSLKDGSEKIADANTGSANAKMMSSPVTTKETKITKVANNGSAMSPYMMSISLWIAAMAFNLIYPIGQRYLPCNKRGSNIRLWLAKSTIFIPMAILAAVTMVLMLHLVMGFNPVSLRDAFITAIMASVTFMSIIVLINVTLGLPGNFFVLMGLLVQLSVSAGTYPLALSPKIYSKVSPFVPFTYTVKAFRLSISGGGSIKGSMFILALFIIACSVLTVFVYKIKNRNTDGIAYAKEQHLSDQKIVIQNQLP